MPITTAVEVLARARKRLEDPARWERIHFQVAGRFCLLGSLGYTGCLIFETSEQAEIDAIQKAYRILTPIVRKYTGDYIDTVGGFNGRNSTQHHEILCVLDLALDKARELA